MSLSAAVVAAMHQVRNSLHCFCTHLWYAGQSSGVHARMHADEAIGPQLQHQHLHWKASHCAMLQVLMCCLKTLAAAPPLWV
jgi:hypothetical protein